jgi:hypothetical protein
MDDLVGFEWDFTIFNRTINNGNNIGYCRL